MNLENRVTLLELKLNKLLEDKSNKIMELYSLENIMRLPDYLIRTLFEVIKLKGHATATEVANRTFKQRPVESAHLNQLERLGFLTKHKEGKTAIFMIQVT